VFPLSKHNIYLSLGAFAFSTDICGVCGGDGKTCRTAGGAFNESKYGYNAILRIPAGASNIDIRQRSFDDTARDDNYLALQDSNEEYLLNGHFVVSMFRKTIHYGGSILEYSGSDEVVERINSSSRPIKSDLILQVLSVGKLHPPDINYQYVISLSYNAGGSSTSNSIEARWTFTDRWTTCNEICQGTQSRIQVCSNLRTMTEISSEYCRNIGQLNEEKRPCNTHCTLKWAKYQKPCDCVTPNRTEVSFKCVRETLSNKTYISDGYCSKLEKPSGIPDCIEECSRPKWRWTQWSECSARCGDGVQIRNVWCQRYNMQGATGDDNSENDNYVLLPDSDCVSVKPSTRRKCHNGPCGQWKVDQWSPVSNIFNWYYCIDVKLRLASLIHSYVAN
jgi:thrombospondin motif-containing protein 9